MDSEVGDPYENKVERIMNTALAEILTESGFDLEVIPDDLDDAGCVFVRGMAAPEGREC